MSVDDERHAAEPMPVVELTLAATATCDHCGCDNLIRLPFVGQGSIRVPQNMRCGHCDRDNLIDAGSFLRIFAR